MRFVKVVFSVTVLCVAIALFPAVAHSQSEGLDWVYEIPLVPDVEQQFDSIGRYDGSVAPFAVAYGKDGEAYIGDLTSDMELDDAQILKALEDYYESWRLAVFNEVLIKSMESVGLDDEIRKAFKETALDKIKENIPGYPPAYWKASHYQGMVRGNNPDGTPMLVVARNGNQKDFAKQNGDISFSFSLPSEIQTLWDDACDSDVVCYGFQQALDSCGTACELLDCNCLLHPNCWKLKWGWWTYCSCNCCEEECKEDICPLAADLLQTCKDGVNDVCGAISSAAKAEYSVTIPKCDLLELTDFKCQDNEPGDLHVVDMSSRPADGGSIGPGYSNPADLTTWNEKLDREDIQWMHPGGGQSVGFRYTPEGGDEYRAQLAFFGTNGLCDITDDGVCTGDDESIHSAIVVLGTVPGTANTKSYTLKSIKHYYDKETGSCPVDGSRHIMPYMQNLAVTIRGDKVLFAYSYGGTLDFFHMTVDDLYTLMTTDDPNECAPLIRRHTTQPPYPQDLAQIVGWDRSELRDKDGRLCDCAPSALGCTDNPACSLEDFPNRPQNMSYVQDTDGNLYLITMFNDPDKEAYIRDVMSPLGLYQVIYGGPVVDADGSEKWTVEVRYISTRDVDLGDFAKGTTDYMGDYLAAGTAYVGPTGRLFVYSAEHYPWGRALPGQERRELRLGELSSISPVLSAIGDQTANEGEETVFDLGQFSVGGNPTGVHWQVSVSWGDGSPMSVFVGAPDAPLNAAHTYADGPATHQVTVTVTESKYEFEGNTSFQVHVDNQSPTVDAGLDQTIYEGDTLTLDPAIFTDPGFDCETCSSPSVETFTARVDWGDGEQEPEEDIGLEWVTGDIGTESSGTVAASHLYGGKPGVHQVEVCVRDDDMDDFQPEACDFLNVTVAPGFLRFCAYSDDAHHGVTLHQSVLASCATVESGVPGDTTPSGVGSRGDIQIKDDAVIENMLVSLDDKIDVGKDVSVAGAMTAGGDVKIDQRSRISDSIVSGHKVELKRDVWVGGEIAAADSVKLHSGATVDGIISENGDDPYIPAVTFVRFSVAAGSEKITVKKGESRELAPGVYKDVKVEKGATLVLTGMEPASEDAFARYVFKQFKMEQEAVLQLNLVNGPIVVDVAQNLEFKENVKVLSDTGDAREFLVRVAGARAYLKKGGTYLGTYLAPYANVKLEDEATLVGALYGKKVEVGKRANISGLPALDLTIVSLEADQGLGGLIASAAGESRTVDGTVQPMIGIHPSAIHVTLESGMTEDALVDLLGDGDAILEWKATSDQSWLTLPTVSGATPANLGLGIDTTGLMTGEHEGTVTVVDPRTSQEYYLTVDLVVEMEMLPVQIYLPLIGQ